MVGAVVGIVGCMQAMEVINIITRNGAKWAQKMVYYDCCMIIRLGPRCLMYVGFPFIFLSSIVAAVFVHWFASSVSSILCQLFY